MSKIVRVDEILWQQKLPQQCDTVDVFGLALLGLKLIKKKQALYGTRRVIIYRIMVLKIRCVVSVIKTNPYSKITNAFHEFRHVYDNFNYLMHITYRVNLTPEISPASFHKLILKLNLQSSILY